MQHNDVISPRALAPDPPRNASERSALESFLDYYRSVLARKAAGLTADQLDTTVGTGTLTLGRLLRHMAFVEDHWFIFVLHGDEYPHCWAAADWDAQPDWEMDTAPEFSPRALMSQFDDAVERARSATDGIGLDRVAARQGPGGPTNLRWILIHMIEEYARHCGHADLIREAIDGAVGD